MFIYYTFLTRNLHEEFLICTLFSSAIQIYLLASKISDEKSTDNLIEGPLHVTSTSSCCFLYLLLAFNSLIMMCLHVGHFDVMVMEYVELLGCLCSCLSPNLGNS